LFDHSLFNGHPRFYGYITSSAAPIGILAELLAAAVNANVGAWNLAPMATEIEVQVIRWLAQFIGYPADCGGLLLSGGNMANITCFLAARAAMAGWDIRTQGITGGARLRASTPPAKLTHGSRKPLTLTDPACRELVQNAADLSMVISIPLRVEDRRQGSWLVDIPDVDREEIAGLIQAFPNARFLLVNGSGYDASSLGRKASGLPSNYVIDIALLTAEVPNETSRLTENLGDDRVVFGTGIPFHYPGPALTEVRHD
jgi:hypothetical protein